MTTLSKRSVILTILSSLFFAVILLPLVVSAQASGGNVGGTLTQLFQSFISFINDILVPLVFAVAFLVFIWGVTLYFILGGGDEEKRERGKSLMIWGIVGFVLIVGIWGIVNLLGDALGIQGQQLDVPEVPQRG